MRILQDSVNTYIKHAKLLVIHRLRTNLLQYEIAENYGLKSSQSYRQTQTV